MALPIWTNQEVLDQLNTEFSWGSSVITYTFPTKSSGMYGASSAKKGFSALNADQQVKAKLALQLWDDLIDPSFVQVFGSSDIEFANSKKLSGYAYGYYPDVGSVWFNKSYPDLQKPVVGNYGFSTFVHEIGHAIGLDHMGQYDGAGDWTPSSFQDSAVYSTMSYFGPNGYDGVGSVAWADWTSAEGITYEPQTPMMNDIMAIQTTYGADYSTRTGNTTYGFNSTDTTITNAIYNFAINLNPILCLYDAGGIDTLDLSGWNTSCVINLNPGTFSDANDMTSNISIARDVWIENVVGGGGNDRLIGNDADNQLSGMGGFDVIDGGYGIDTVVYNGNSSDFGVFIDWATNIVTVEGLDTGIDKISNTEFIQFDDGIFSFVGLFDPANPGEMPTIPFAFLSAVDTNVSEGTITSGVFTFAVTLDAAAMEDLSFDYQIYHQGEYSAEAYDFAGSLTGSVTVVAGSLIGTFNVNVLADVDYEIDETFGVRIIDSSAGVIVFDDYALGEIINDDLTPPTTINGTKKANTLNGTDGGNHIYGLAGKDVIHAMGGKDFIDGGTGNDILTGGAGEDGFRFADKKFGKDVITDFVDGLDWLSFAPVHADSFDDLNILNNGTTSVTIVMGKNTVTINGIANITLDVDDFAFY